MKQFFFSLIVLLSYSLNAQDTSLVYLNFKWQPTSLENAEYKRYLIKKKSDYYVVEDYLINGLPYLRGQFHSKEIKQPFGEFISYDENGAISEVYNYNNESQLHGDYKTYDSEGQIDAQRNYLNGMKNGLWTWHYSNGLVAWFEQWRNDTLVMLQQFSSSGVEYDSKYNLSISPKWGMSDESLNSFISKRLPENFKKNEIQGIIYLYINAAGKLLRVESKSQINGDLLEAIRKVLIKDSEWLPALSRLRPIDGILECEINIPKVPVPTSGNNKTKNK